MPEEATDAPTVPSDHEVIMHRKRARIYDTSAEDDRWIESDVLIKPEDLP